jgi:hypothetical protein
MRNRLLGTALLRASDLAHDLSHWLAVLGDAASAHGWRLHGPPKETDR